MLGKLIKHEFRATRWNFSILLAVMIGITLLMKPLFWIRRGIMESDGIQITVTEMLVIWAFFMMLSILITAAEVLIVIRYYQSMTCDEAYLTFTLPVTPTQIIWSKVMVGGIWYLAVFLISMVCVVLAFAGTPFMQNVWSVLWSDMSVTISTGSIAAWGLELIPIILSRMLFLICVIGIGQLFGKYRLLGTIGTYFVIQMVMVIVLFVIEVSTGMVVFNYVEINAGEMELLVLNNENLVIWGFVLNMAYALILGSGAFLGARYIFSKKLNLE